MTGSLTGSTCCKWPAATARAVALFSGEATKLAGLASVGKSWPRIGADEGLTVDGTRIAFVCLKNVSNDPSFFFFASLSCLTLVSLHWQIFDSRCLNSRLAIPTGPQWIRVLQSGQIAHPSASSTPSRMFYIVSVVEPFQAWLEE